MSDLNKPAASQPDYDSKQGKLKRYYVEIDELDEQEDVKSPYLARAIYLANEVDAVIATERAERFAAEQRILYLEAREKRLMELADQWDKTHNFMTSRRDDVCCHGECAFDLCEILEVSPDKETL